MWNEALFLKNGVAPDAYVKYFSDISGCNQCINENNGIFFKKKLQKNLVE